MVPLFLTYWGAEKYGLWLALFSVVTLFKILESGHANYIGNEFNIHVFKDVNKAKRLLGSSLRIVFFLYLIECLFFFLLIYLGFANIVFNVESTSFKENDIVLGVAYLLIIWGIFGSFGGIIVKILPVFGYFSTSTYLGVLSKFLEIIVLGVGVFFNLSLSALALLLATVLAIYSICILFYIKNLLPDLFPWWESGSFREGWINFNKSLVLTSNNFINKFSTDGLVLVISSVLGSAIVPVYTTIRTLANIGTQVTTLVLNPLKPELIRYHAKEEFGKVMEVIKTNWFIMGIILNVSFLISLLFIDQLYAFWTKGQLPFDFQLFLLLVFSVLILNYGQIFISYLSGINNLKALFIITFFRGLMIFGGSFLLVPKIGLVAVGWVFVVTEVLVSAFLPFYFFQKLIRSNSIFKSSTYSILSIVLVGIVFLLYYTYESNFLFLIGLGTLYLSWLQFNNISSEVKNRILSIIQTKTGFLQKIH